MQKSKINNLKSHYSNPVGLLQLNFISRCLGVLTLVLFLSENILLAGEPEISKIRNNPEISSIQIDSINESAFSLVFSDQEKVIEMMRKNQYDAWNIRDTNAYLTALNILGIAHDIHGTYDSSSYYFNKTLELSKLYNNKVIEEKSINNLGMMNWHKGNLFIAQQYFFDALKLSESQNNEKRTSVALSNIGLIYQELSMYQEALVFNRRALALRLKTSDLYRTLPLSYNNLAICFEHLNKIDSAIILINRGVEIAREIGNKQAEGNLLATLGNCYFELNNYPLALKYSTEGARIQLESGNTINIYKTYNSISEIYLKMDNPQMALEYVLKSKELIDKADIESEWQVYYQLSRAYFALGNRKLGEYYFERSNQVKDSVFSQSHARSFAELEVIHKAQQKENDLNLYKIKLAEEHIKVQTRNLYLFLLSSGLFIFFILVIGYFKKQKLRRELIQKALVLRDTLAKAEIQNELNNERFRISKDLHDNIGSQLTLVTSSLDNLCYKVLESETKSKLTQISGFTKFTIQQLRDTIWALTRNEFTLNDFHLRVLNYINKAKQSCPGIKFESTCTGNKTQILTPEQGINLLYVVQEIINNSIKYAKCSIIKYSLSIKNEILVFDISDNGKGFKKEEIEIGNGLLNIDSRIKKVNGNYSLNSAPGAGTSFNVNIRLSSYRHEVQT